MLCLALVLGNCLFLCPGANGIEATNPPEIKIISPQESVNVRGLGTAIFRKQSSGFSLQVPVGFRKDGEKIYASNTSAASVQAWLLKIDGTAVLQSEKPSIISLGTVEDYSTDYLFFSFSEVPEDELYGVVVSSDGKFYCHQIEISGHQPSIAPPDENLVRISPANISHYPLSVSVTNFDNWEHITVFYQTDKAVFDKFLYAREEISDGDVVILSEPIAGAWTTNGVRFEFGGGNVWPFKFKIIEEGHRGETGMPGYSGYWLYERDFATNLPMKTNILQVANGYWDMVLQLPGLNESIFLTDSQSREYSVQLETADYPGTGHRSMPTVAELHRQAWLLRADGTVFFQAQPPDRAGVGNGGWESDRLIFKFPHKEGDDAVGLAVSIGGNLYCHALK